MHFVLFTGLHQATEAAVKYSMPVDRRAMTDPKSDVSLLLALQCIPAGSNRLALRMLLQEGSLPSSIWANESFSHAYAEAPFAWSEIMTDMAAWSDAVPQLQQLESGFLLCCDHVSVLQHHRNRGRHCHWQAA